MGTEKFKNLFLILGIILVLIGIPFLLYRLGSLIEFNYFGYINNWWVVLLFILVLVAIFVLRGVDFEKKMGQFFLILFTCSFFILGIRFGVKSDIDMQSYAVLIEKEAEIDRLDSMRVILENDLLELVDQSAQSNDAKSYEIIFFEAGRAELSDYNKDRITTFVSTFENCKLNVNGYSDDSGNKTTNMNISLKRANNVADFIRSIDQHNNIINTVAGFGDDYELVANRDDLSRGKNRRVSIEIVGKIDGAFENSRKNIQDELNKNREEIKNIKRERDSLRKLIFPALEG